MPVHCNPEGQQCVFVHVYKCVSLYTVLMLICPSDQHCQFVGFPLLCSLNFNITPSLQFPPAATSLNLGRSYQHNSLMTIKPSGWRKHHYTDVCTRTPTHTYMNTYRHSNVSCVSDGNFVFMLFHSQFTTWEYTSLTQEKRNQFYAGNYLHTIFWQKL